MCGFVGFSGDIRGINGEKVIKEMLDCIVHRGPDSQEIYTDDTTAFGFARLSIIDLEGGTQPIFNEDESLVLIFNGEIYNFRELRAELEKCGHIFRTHTDSEVIIHGYEEYGAKITTKLRGMFAFTIWNKKTKELFGARDHFGIKPYYYAEMGGTLLFGSEIKSFLPHPHFKKELNEEALPNYLTFACVPAYETFFRGVYKLPPAHSYTYKGGKLTLERYFTPMLEPQKDKSLEECGKDILDVVEESVKAHQFSDVEVGCFLSSGVDSSYVAYELSKLQQVQTYTIGFAEKKYSEAEDAKVLADEIKVKNTVKEVTGQEYFDNVGKVQYHLDEPLANPSANLLYFVSQRAAQDVKVVLSGEGADEMFAGYNVYKEPLAVGKYQKALPKSLRKAIASVARSQKEFKGRNFLIRGSQTVEERYLGNSNIYTVAERNGILKKQYSAREPQYYTNPFYQEVQHLDDISKMQYMDIHVWMVQEILLKADKMSMAHSLELRVPFLDTEVFSVAKTVPTEHKVSEENTKLALRWAAREKFNRTSANRVKKAFPLPLPEWLREEQFYQQVKTAFTSPQAEQFFQVTQILSILEEHKEGKPQRTNKIWAIYSFLVWYDEFFIKR